MIKYIEKDAKKYIWNKYSHNKNKILCQNCKKNMISYNNFSCYLKDLNLNDIENVIPICINCKNKKNTEPNIYINIKMKKEYNTYDELISKKLKIINEIENNNKDGYTMIFITDTIVIYRTEGKIYANCDIDKNTDIKYFNMLLNTSKLTNKPVYTFIQNIIKISETKWRVFLSEDNINSDIPYYISLKSYLNSIKINYNNEIYYFWIEYDNVVFSNMTKQTMLYIRDDMYNILYNLYKKDIKYYETSKLNSANDYPYTILYVHI